LIVGVWFLLNARVNPRVFAFTSTYLQPARRSRVLAAWFYRAAEECNRWSSASQGDLGCMEPHPWAPEHSSNYFRRRLVVSAAPHCVWRHLRDNSSRVPRPRTRPSDKRMNCWCDKIFRWLCIFMWSCIFMNYYYLDIRRSKILSLRKFWIS